MIISVITAIVGLVLIYLAMNNLGKWKFGNIFLAFFGGWILLLSAAGSMILPQAVEFIEKIAHVS